MISGPLRKMRAVAGEPIAYSLPVGESLVALEDRIGERIELRYGGEILCAHCGRKTPKSYNQGYCFPCCRKLAACDMCILRPERCHYHEGTCREPEWGLANCMRPHYVYLANTSGLKVGITREGQTPTRWIDQGAAQALPIMRVSSRQVSGLVEVAIAGHVSDRTDWRAMLRGSPDPLDLAAERDRLLDLCAHEIESIRGRFGQDAMELLPGAEAQRFEYPVLEYPTTVRSMSFDKQPGIGGRLLGIKGQYLIFDSGVVNIRRFGSYVVSVAD